MSSYVTAKWGVHGLVRTLQIEARATPGIDVSLVWPGGVDTPVYLQAGTYLQRHGGPPPRSTRPRRWPPRRSARCGRRSGRSWSARSTGSSSRGFRLLPAVFDVLVTPLMRLSGLGREEVANSPGNVLSPTPEGEAVHGRWSRRLS